MSFIESHNPILQGKKLKLENIIPSTYEKTVVYRPRDTFFRYCAWPSVCRDENGTLYALSAAFGSEHICPFNKVAMYISKNNGKTWSPPIVVVDTYLPDGHGGITYLGNGRLIINWNYMPGDVMFNEYYERVGGGYPQSLAKARQAMIDTYSDVPPEKLVGGSFVKISEDYGFTWSDPIRMPISAIHGLCQCKNGDLIYFGKESFADPSKTFEEGAFDPIKHKSFESRAEYLNYIHGESRGAKESVHTPMYACVSRDGGYTWEKLGQSPATDLYPMGIQWEPHMIELDDGTLLSAIRMESEVNFENDFTVCLTRSNDGGKTWGDLECTHIPGSPPHLLKHSSGKLICAVGCRVEEDGYGIYAYVSDDDGKTFTKKYVIDDKSPNNDLGYPCSVELEDGSIVTVYYQYYYDEKTGEYDNKPCIQCVRWTL